MKKLLTALAALLAVFGFAGAGTVSAAEDCYPLCEAALTVSTPAPAPGAKFTATFTGADPGETVKFEFNGGSATATANAEGVAIVELVAPSLGGTFPIKATGQTSGRSATASITVTVPPTTTVPGGDLPGTGTDSGQTILMAGGLVVVGAGLAGVAGLRRRPRTA